MINEHDLADFKSDFIYLPVQPLYKCKRDSWFSLDGALFKLDHIDGMYSVCYDASGFIVHISCVAPVFPLEEKQ